MRRLLALLVLVAGSGCAEPCPDGERFTPRGQQVAGYADCPDGQLILCNAQTCSGEPGAYYCETTTHFLGAWLMQECEDCVVEWDEELALEATCPDG